MLRQQPTLDWKLVFDELEPLVALREAPEVLESGWEKQAKPGVKWLRKVSCGEPCFALQFEEIFFGL